jgi:hypothetical protein
MDLVNGGGGGGISFFVRPNEIRGLSDISISADAETEEQTAWGEKVTVKKNAGGYQIQLTGELNAALNVDVKEVALQITEAARNGDSGYFYIGDEKLFPSSFMCVSANVNNIRLMANGKWVSCTVQMTLKQCEKYGGAVDYSSYYNYYGNDQAANEKKTEPKPEDTKKGAEAVTSFINTAKTFAQNAFNLLTGKNKKKSSGGMAGGGKKAITYVNLQ